ncbi:MAG: hypothetical protein AAGA47_03060 [Pseudomonadota bacterium]
MARPLPKSPGPHRLTGRAPAPGQIRAWGWALVGPLVCFAILVAISFGFWVQPVQEARQFRGVLRPATAPLGIDVPQFAILRQVVVEQGEVVRDNQTLALLDVQAMEHRRVEVLHDLAVARLKRHCFVSQGADISLETLAAWLSLEPAQSSSRPRQGGASATGIGAASSVELSTRLDLAEQDCGLRRAVWQAASARGQAELAQLKEKEALLTSKLSVVVEVGSEMPSSSQAFEALNLLLERNATLEDIAELSSDVAALEIERDGRRLEEAEDLTLEINALMGELRALDGLIAKPRITSPASGLITRARDPGPAYRARGAERLFDLARSGQQRFVLAMAVPPDEIAKLRDGARVDVTLVGHPEAPMLGGAIDKDRPATGAQAADTLMVNLDGAAREWLGSGRRAVAFGGAGTQTLVQVSMGTTTFGTMVARAAEQALGL